VRHPRDGEAGAQQKPATRTTGIERQQQPLQREQRGERKRHVGQSQHPEAARERQ